MNRCQVAHCPERDVASVPLRLAGLFILVWLCDEHAQQVHTDSDASVTPAQ